MIFKKARIPLILIILFVGIWYCITEFFGIREIFLPSPGRTFSALFNLLCQYEFWADLGSSWYRVIVGFFVSFLIAYPLTMMAIWSNSLKESIFYIVEFFRYLPVPVFIPITILWFGVDDLSKVVIIVLGTFAQMIPMFYDSAKNIENKYASFNFALKWSKWRYIEKVVIKGSSPAILDNSRICLGWAWTYLIVAEIVGAEHGIGYAMIRAQRYLAIDKIFAYIIVIGLIGVLTDRSLVLIRKRIYPWHK